MYPVSLARVSIRPPAKWRWTRDAEVVTRRVTCRPDVLDRVLAGDVLRTTVALAHGYLYVDRHERRDDGELMVAWHAAGRLYGSGPRLARYARVEIELAPFSESKCELRLRPVCRHLYRWGDRRQRRYFVLAHRAADALVRVVVDAISLTSAGQ